MPVGDGIVDSSVTVEAESTMTEKSHPVAKLARDAVERFVREGEIMHPEAVTAEMKERAGVFVSIHKHGQLRGCIGTFEPTRASVAEEVVANAISSATRDPRFHPVAPAELDSLDYSVDILTHPEPVRDESELDAHRYGVIVESGWRKGLLLPDLDGVDTVGQQIEICRMKAGIPSNEPVHLHRFEVRRYR